MDHSSDECAEADESTDSIETLWSLPDADVATVIDSAKHSLYTYFVRRIASRDDAADLTADVMLVMWQKSESLPTGHNEARMWAFGIARNILKNYRRRLYRRHELSERIRSESLISGDTKPVRDDVWEALRLLSEIDREIVQLVHWDGFSLAEVATMLGRKPATIRSRYSRAREKLKFALEKLNREE